MWGGTGGSEALFWYPSAVSFPCVPPPFNSVDETPLPTACSHSDTPSFQQKGMYKDFSDFEITKAPPLQSLAPPLCDGKQILALVLGLLRL